MKMRLGQLDAPSADPFDRMLVAQAQLEDLAIVARDPRIPQYGVPTPAA